MHRDDGFTFHKTYLDRTAQAALVGEVLRRVGQSPLYTPSMPRTGKPMSVRMTNFGPLGWVTDKIQGYRYQASHPVTEEPWPDMPQALIDIWQDVSGWDAPPQACLVNWYGETARLGQHIDADEDARDGAQREMIFRRANAASTGTRKHANKALFHPSVSGCCVRGGAGDAYHGMP